MEVIPSRDLNLLYILLDIGFLLILAGALLWCRKYLAALFGLFGGLLYFLVDYGGFYLLLGTRGGQRRRPVLVPSLAEHELWLHEFRMDLALARPGRACPRMVGPHRCGLAGRCPAQPELRRGICPDRHLQGDWKLPRHHGPGSCLSGMPSCASTTSAARKKNGTRCPGFWPSGYWCSSLGSSSFSSPASVPAALARCWSIPCSKRIWVSPISF